MLAPRSASAARAPRLPGPIGAALGLPAGVAVALVTWFLGGNPGVGLVLAALAGAGVAALTSPAGALLAASQCWAFLDGFLINRLGTLGAGRADLVALGIVVGVALAAHVTARVVAPGPTRSSGPGYPRVRIVDVRADTMAHRA